MSHEDQASRVGFEKATSIAIDNLDSSNRELSSKLESIAAAHRTVAFQAAGVPNHAKRLEALEAAIVDQGRHLKGINGGELSPTQLIPGIMRRLADLESEREDEDDQSRDEDTEDMRTLLADACDCLCDPRFRDFVTRGRPLSSAHRSQLAGIMARLQPFAEDTLLG